MKKAEFIPARAGRSQRPLDAVFIVGPRISSSNIASIRKHYKKSGLSCCIIGNGKRFIVPEELNQLHGRLGPNTRIDINAHGGAWYGPHTMSLFPNGGATSEVFQKITEVSSNIPLAQIHLWSCYGGAAARDIEHLPKGTTFIAHSSAETVTFFDQQLFADGIKRHRQRVDGFTEFAHTFKSSPETAVIASIHPETGNRLHYTARTPDRPLSPLGLTRYLNDKTLTEYGQALATFNEQEDIQLVSDLRLIPVSDTYKKAPLLHEAAMRGDKKHVKSLLENGAEIDRRRNGDTPLMKAVWYGNPATIKELLKAGADVNASSLGWTALSRAANSGNAGAVKELLKVDANYYSSNPLMVWVEWLAKPFMVKKEINQLMDEHAKEQKALKPILTDALAAIKSTPELKALYNNNKPLLKTTLLLTLHEQEKKPETPAEREAFIRDFVDTLKTCQQQGKRPCYNAMQEVKAAAARPPQQPAPALLEPIVEPTLSQKKFLDMDKAFSFTERLEGERQKGSQKEIRSTP